MYQMKVLDPLLLSTTKTYRMAWNSPF